MVDETKFEIVFSFDLAKPLIAHGQPTSKLEFRKPTAGDIARYGMPVKFNPFAPGDGVAFDEPKMSAMLAHLASVNLGAINEMEAQDWASCAWGLTGFFLPGVRGETST